MMDKPIIRRVDTYKDMIRKLTVMLRHAEQGEWDEFFNENTAVLTNQRVMAHIHDTYGVSDQERVEAKELLGEVLELQDKIKTLLIQRRDEIGLLLESAKLQESRGGMGQAIDSGTYSRADLYRHRRP